MRIVLVGNHLLSYTSETHHTKSLESLGHQVIKLQQNRASGEQILNESLKSDMLVYIFSHGWQTPGLSIGEVYKRLRKAGIPTVTYHLDAFFSIPERWNIYKNHEYLDVQYFFTPDKNLANWITANKNKGYYLPAGVFEQECIEVPHLNEAHPVIFVGSKGYHSGWSYRPRLINWLAATYGDKFGLYGNDGLRIIRGLELNAVYQSSKIAVGDTYSPNYNYPYYYSDRLFEVPGRLGFQIFPYIKGLEDNFELNKEIVTYTFGDTRQLKSLIDYYLINESEREAIRKAGHERAVKDHTYAQRWKHILETVK